MTKKFKAVKLSGLNTVRKLLCYKPINQNVFNTMKNHFFKFIVFYSNCIILLLCTFTKLPAFHFHFIKKDSVTEWCRIMFIVVTKLPICFLLLLLHLVTSTRLCTEI